MSELRTIASPTPNPETQEFWDAASKGELLLKKCEDCGNYHYYPRAVCPHCFSDKTTWVKASGTGEIYTYSVMKRSKIPYAIAYVTVDEGVKLMTNIVDADLDALAIGQKVKVVFKPSEDGQLVPMFTPA